MENMRILIATGLFPPDIGGPAQYAKHLYDEFTKQGHSVDVVSFRHERKMPQGIRHFFYSVRIFPFVKRADFVLAMDTFSVGFPVVLAGKILGKKVIIRIGGDFLWESYVERHKARVTLKDFNMKMPHLSGKEKIIFHLSRWTLQRASALAFNSEWQKNIFFDSYGLMPKKIFVVENFYPPLSFDKFRTTEGKRPEMRNKIFLWAGRDIVLKNVDTLRRAFAEAKKIRNDISLELITDMSHEQLLGKIEESYAVILPSFSDVNPNFIIDAISRGKPFIMTRETGIYERLKDIGIFIDPLDENDLKEKILFLADERNYGEYRKKIEHFNFTHSWEEIADEYLNIMQITRMSANTAK